MSDRDRDPDPDLDPLAGIDTRGILSRDPDILHLQIAAVLAGLASQYERALGDLQVAALLYAARYLAAAGAGLLDGGEGDDSEIGPLSLDLDDAPGSAVSARGGGAGLVDPDLSSLYR